MAKNQVKVNFPNLSKEAFIAVPGVGEVYNGSTVTVDDFEIQTWENFTGTKWPEEGLVLPAPGEPNPTEAQTEGAIQAAIIGRQNERSDEAVKKESALVTKAVLRGQWPYPLMVDGVIVAKAKTSDEAPVVPAKDPVVVSANAPKGSKGKE